MGESEEHRCLERSLICSINMLNSYNKIICGLLLAGNLHEELRDGKFINVF